MDFSSSANRSFGSNKSFGTPSRSKGGSRTVRDERNLMRGRKLSPEDEKYPSAIQLYLQPPTMDISLESFEDLAVQRLKVRLMSSLILKGPCYRNKLFHISKH